MRFAEHRARIALVAWLLALPGSPARANAMMRYRFWWSRIPWWRRVWLSLTWRVFEKPKWDAALRASREGA